VDEHKIEEKVMEIAEKLPVAIEKEFKDFNENKA
jgi:hypothetical protein